MQGTQSVELADGMGFLFLDHSNIGHLRFHAIPALVDTPMAGLVMFQGGGPGGAPHHQIAARIPFSDTRAEQFLTSEARQLPKGKAGLIMICAPTSRNELRVWSELIQRRFQPSMHTRVGCVCLFEGEMMPVENRYSWAIRAQMVINPYAQVPLPTWIQDTVASANPTW